MAQRYEPTIHHRQSARLRGYDYAQAGAYFVTICSQGRQCVFGEIVDGEMRLNEIGEIVAACWHVLPDHFAHVALDAFVVMPNHMHGIVVIDATYVGAGLPRPSNIHPINAYEGAETAPLHHAHPPLPAPVGAGLSRPIPTNHKQHPTLGRVMAYFKYQTTKHINTTRATSGLPAWQRNYYDHIVRNDAALDRIRDYIATNPLRWDGDQLHPDNPSR